MEKTLCDTIIIGAGAAGLTCAAAAGRRGRRVAVVDHADAAGIKIDISGGGRCNFTNRDVTPDHFWSDNEHFCKSALARYRPELILDLADRHDIAWHEKREGRIFCRGPASQITAMLLEECDLPDVSIHLGCGIDDVSVAKNGGGSDGSFRVATGPSLFGAPSLVVATGGLSRPGLGATDLGHSLAEKFGLRVVPPRPGLVPFTFFPADRDRFAPLAGSSAHACVTCGRRSFRGSVLFTHVGLSGPAILQASCCWKPEETLTIDLLPGTTVTDLVTTARKKGDMRHLKTILSRRVPKRLVETLCGDLLDRRPGGMYGRDELEKIASALQEWRIVPEDTEGYEKAEVTLGGVDTRELSSKTMESRKVSGLFFVGEVIDVTGRLGGYNLHWAWASGTAAGEAV